MFLHGGFLHIASNMLYLFIFGDNVEDRLGHLRFLIFYFVCGIAAGHHPHRGQCRLATSRASAPRAPSPASWRPTCVLFPHAQVRTLLFIGPFILVPRIAAAFLIIFWFVTQFITGITSLGATTDRLRGVAVWAHVGGFIAGLILVQVMRPRARQPALSY